MQSWCCAFKQDRLCIACLNQLPLFEARKTCLLSLYVVPISCLGAFSKSNLNFFHKKLVLLFPIILLLYAWCIQSYLFLLLWNAFWFHDLFGIHMHQVILLFFWFMPYSPHCCMLTCYASINLFIIHKTIYN